MSIFPRFKQETLQAGATSNGETYTTIDNIMCIHSFDFHIGYRLKSDAFSNGNLKDNVMQNLFESDFLNILDNIQITVDTVGGSSKTIIDYDSNSIKLYMAHDGIFYQNEVTEQKLRDLKGTSRNRLLKKIGNDWFLIRKYNMRFYNPSATDKMARLLGGINIGEFPGNLNVAPEDQISQLSLRVKFKDLKDNVKTFKGAGITKDSDVYFRVLTSHSAHQKNIEMLNTTDEPLTNLLLGAHPATYFYSLQRSTLTVSGGNNKYRALSQQVIDAVYFVGLSKNLYFRNSRLSFNTGATSDVLFTSSSDGIRDIDGWHAAELSSLVFRPAENLDCLGVLTDKEGASRFFISLAALNNGSDLMGNLDGSYSVEIDTDLGNNDTANQQVDVYTIGYRRTSRA